MKKTPFILSLLLCLTMPGCGAAPDTGSSIGTPEVPPAETAEPAWAQVTETDGQLFQGLNLDGVGDADDEAYVSVCQYGEYEGKITVLRIHLGTGETMANVFPVYGHCNFSTGTLFSEDKEAIVLEIAVPGSNYGAAHLFVLDINPMSEDPIPESTVRMDTTKGIRFNSDIDLPEGYRTDFEGSTGITANTRIVDVADSPLQGLEIHAVGETVNSENGQKEDLSQVFLWGGGNTRGDDGWELSKAIE